ITSQSDTSKSFNILEQLDVAAAGHDMTTSWDVLASHLVPEHFLDRDAEVETTWIRTLEEQRGKAINGKTKKRVTYREKVREDEEGEH
ncbi:hypothetical protein NEUTE2DRAFT_53293, partial [Neurospora tetrasperma FGSC 2509]